MSILGGRRSASRGLGHKELGPAVRSTASHLLWWAGADVESLNTNFKSVDSHVAYLAGTAKELQSQRVDDQFLVWIPHLDDVLSHGTDTKWGSTLRHKPHSQRFGGGPELKRLLLAHVLSIAP